MWSPNSEQVNVCDLNTIRDTVRRENKASVGWVNYPIVKTMKKWRHDDDDDDEHLSTQVGWEGETGSAGSLVGSLATGKRLATPRSNSLALHWKPLDLHVYVRIHASHHHQRRAAAADRHFGLTDSTALPTD